MSTNEKIEHWANLAIDAWLNTLDQKKLTFKKIVLVTKKCLTIMSLKDAAKFMTKYKLAITDENIARFNQLADEFYMIRKEIFRDLVLDEYNKSK